MRFRSKELITFEQLSAIVLQSGRHGKLRWEVRAGYSTNHSRQ